MPDNPALMTDTLKQLQAHSPTTSDTAASTNIHQLKQLQAERKQQHTLTWRRPASEPLNSQRQATRRPKMALFIRPRKINPFTDRDNRSKRPKGSRRQLKRIEFPVERVKAAA